MHTQGKNAWFLAMGGVLSTLMVAMICAARAAERTTDPALWLQHFLGEPVAVRFIEAPPGMQRLVRARRMDAEIPGIVLQIRDREVFFPHANIISIEPPPK